MYTKRNDYLAPILITKIKPSFHVSAANLILPLSSPEVCAILQSVFLGS
jgi:hypothetical protein